MKIINKKLDTALYSQKQSTRSLTKLICHPLLITICTLLLSSCATSRYGYGVHDGPPRRNIDVSKIKNPTPKKEKKSRYGNAKSYVVRGKEYHVMKDCKGYEATGIASWYGTKFHNHLTSNREVYSMYEMTAAHKTLPLPTYVKVTNLENNREIIVRVNDRGPFEKNRLIDLSYVAAKKLGICAHGTAPVKIVALDTNTFDTDFTNMAEQQQPTHEFIQIGAYKNPQNAEIIAEKVRSLTSIPCAVYAANDHNEKIYRVKVGPIADSEKLEEVNSALEQMKERSNV